MSSFKKSFLFFIIVLLVAGAFLGCAKKEGEAATAASSTSAAAEEFEIRFYTWTYDYALEPMITAFNEQYDGQYYLTHVRIPNSQTMTINTALASGEKIDLMTQSNAFDLRVRAEAGVYLPLKKYFDRDGLDYATVFGASTEQTQNINGDYYSMPYATGVNFIYFNKKMFDEAGEPYPDPNWTWNDFRATAKRMTKGSGANKIYGAMVDVASPTQAHQFWTSIAHQKLGVFYYYNQDLKSTRFDHPAIKESLQFFYDLLLVDQSAVPYDEYLTLKYDDGATGIKGLVEGRFAMFFIPEYGCLYLDPDYIGELPAGTDIGMTNFPRPEGMDPVTVVYTSQSCIPANAPNPDASWIFLRFMCYDRADLFAAPKAMHTGYQVKTEEEANFINDIIYRNHPGFDYDMAMKVNALPRNFVNRDNTITQGQAKINELLRANLSRVFNGELSVDAALADLKTKGDQFITEDLNAR